MKKSNKDTYKKVERGIYRRGEYSFQVKMMVGGHTITETFDSVEDARAYRDSKRVAKSLDPDFKRVLESKINKRDAASFTLEHALSRYEKEVTPLKKGAYPEQCRIAKLKRYSIAKASFYKINADDVSKFLKSLITDGLSENSCRKYLALISHCYNVAIKRWRLNVTNPIKLIELPSNGKPRKRRFEADEETMLYRELGKARNPFMLPIVKLAVETAMRQGELLSLQWKDVHFEEDGSGTAELHDTKNGENRIVPLSTRAVAILRSLPRSKDKTEKAIVFPIAKEALRAAWEAARERADIKNLRFHDLRHEATSRLFELGLDKIEAAAITGHKTLQVLKDYTHLRAQKLAKKLG